VREVLLPKKRNDHFKHRIVVRLSFAIQALSVKLFTKQFIPDVEASKHASYRTIANADEF
jgi:hypothetical protein